MTSAADMQAAQAQAYAAQAAGAYATSPEDTTARQQDTTARQQEPSKTQGYMERLNASMQSKSAMDNRQYMEGFNAGLNGMAWNRVRYAPGTREFHKWLEGHADGYKARVLMIQNQ